MKDKLLKVSSLAVSVVMSVAFVVLISYAASTVSTNITTDGNLTVSGNSTFGDVATDVSLFTGKLHASTSALFTDSILVYGPIRASSTAAHLFINGFATTTASNGNIETEGQVLAEGAIGAASTTPWGNLSVEHTSAADPVFVVSDSGTSTPSFWVDGTGYVGVATSSPTQEFSVVGDVHLGSAATTTLTLSSSATAASAAGVAGGCIQLEGANGTMYRIYATTTGPLIAMAGSCQ